LTLSEPKAEQPNKLTPQKGWRSSFYLNFFLFFAFASKTQKVGFDNILEKIFEIVDLDLQFHSVKELNT